MKLPTNKVLIRIKMLQIHCKKALLSFYNNMLFSWYMYICVPKGFATTYQTSCKMMLLQFIHFDKIILLYRMKWSRMQVMEWMWVPHGKYLVVWMIDSERGMIDFLKDIMIVHTIVQFKRSSTFQMEGNLLYK